MRRSGSCPALPLVKGTWPDEVEIRFSSTSAGYTHQEELSVLASDACVPLPKLRENGANREKRIQRNSCFNFTKGEPERSMRSSG
jgi:hypothetical protein